MDLGKEKYGGPFTFEEVENVKTVFRLLPLLVSFLMGISVLSFIFFPLTININFKWITKGPVNSQIILSSFLFTILTLPLYHFVVYPVFYNCVPTMLKRIGLGLLLSSAYCLTSALAQYIWVSLSENSDNATCILNPEFNATTDYLAVTALAPDVLAFLFLPTIAYFPIEFIVSQTPYQIKGITLSTAYVIVVFFLTMNEIVVILFTEFLSRTTYCGVYYYVVLSFLSLLSFFLFVHFSMKYKLRIRDDIVPIHRLAEEFFEKEELLRRKYEKQMEFRNSY